MIARELGNGRHLCLYCERNPERGRQPTEVAGVGDMRARGCDARKIDARPTLPDTRPLGGLSSVAPSIQIKMAPVSEFACHRGDLTGKQRTVNSLIRKVKKACRPFTPIERLERNMVCQMTGTTFSIFAVVVVVFVC